MMREGACVDWGVLVCTGVVCLCCGAPDLQHRVSCHRIPSPTCIACPHTNTFAATTLCHRIIHIDFGFIFDISPGGNIKFELAPFKLSAEMIELVCVRVDVWGYDATIVVVGV